MAKVGTTLAAGGTPWRLCQAPDVNGDRIADYIVATPYIGRVFPAAGGVHVLSGVDGSQLSEIAGSGAAELMGYCVAPFVDQNGDGRREVLVGSPGDSVYGSHPGRVEVVSLVDGAVLSSWHGKAIWDEYGCAIATLSDMDKDGIPEVLIGASESTLLRAGFAEVRSGETGRSLLTVTGDKPGDQFGYSVGAAMSLDENDEAMFAVGAPQRGTSAGDSLGYVKIYSGLSGKAKVTALGAPGQTAFGSAIGFVSDVDGDGHADMIVAAPLDSRSVQLGGSVSLVSSQNGDRLATFAGDRSGERCGTSIAVIGDVTGDGMVEVAVGCPGSGNGRVVVLSGSDLSLIGEVAGESNGDWFGQSISCVTDIDGDGLDDIFVAAPSALLGNATGYARVVSSCFARHR